MAGRKEQLTAAQIDRKWPHQVEIAVPPLGLDSLLNELHAKAAEIHRATVPAARARGGALHPVLLHLH